jgi:hypothetical protein
VTPSIYFIVLVLVLGTLALGWSFYRRQQFKPAIEPGRSSRSVSLPGKHVSALRVRLGCALVALSLSGLTLLLGPTPSAWAAVSHPLGNKGSTLTVNQVLHGDDYLMSPNGQYVAYMQDDGNFVLYHVSSSGSFTNPYWATGTGGHPNGAFFAIMQSDGNFCIYKGTGPSNNLGGMWCANKTALLTGQYFAVMQDDGNFVVYTGSPNCTGFCQSLPVWATNTAVTPTLPPCTNATQHPYCTPQ